MDALPREARYDRLMGLATIRTVGAVLATSVLIAPPRAIAVPETLTRAVPADAAVAYFWEGGRSAQDSTTVGSTWPGGSGEVEPSGWAAAIIGSAQQFGLLSLLDPELRCWADSAAAALAAGRFPFAIVLFDANAEPRADGGHQLNGLHAALILVTHDRHDEIERQIQHLLSTYTNREFSTLASREDAGRTRFALRDRRLPGWCVLAWGAVGDYYVVAVGEGVFDRVLGALRDPATALFRDEWFTLAARALELDRAAIGLYLRPDAVMPDADPVLRSKVNQVSASLHLSFTDRGLWTIRKAGRAIEVEMIARRDRRDDRRTFASGRLPNGLPHRLIPPMARRYTVVGWNAPVLLDAVARAYLAARAPAARAKLRAFWHDVQSESGVSIEDDIFKHFGPHLVIHNHPEHALRLPFAWTYLISIDGDAAHVRASIEKLFSYARDRMEEGATLRLRRVEARRDQAETAQDGASPGIWYLFAGLNGPALTVTDECLVISFSPQALRSNLAAIAADDVPAETQRDAAAP